MRAGAYSPNHIGNDAAIFNITAEELRKRGCEVNTYTEEQFSAGAATEDIIVNMCRERRSIELLQKARGRGRPGDKLGLRHRKLHPRAHDAHPPGLGHPLP